MGMQKKYVSAVSCLTLWCNFFLIVLKCLFFFMNYLFLKMLKRLNAFKNKTFKYYKCKNRLNNFKNKFNEFNRNKRSNLVNQIL